MLQDGAFISAHKRIWEQPHRSRNFPLSNEYIRFCFLLVADNCIQTKLRITQEAKVGTFWQREGCDWRWLQPDIAQSSASCHLKPFKTHQTKSHPSLARPVTSLTGLLGSCWVWTDTSSLGVCCCWNCECAFTQQPTWDTTHHRFFNLL